MLLSLSMVRTLRFSSLDQALPEIAALAAAATASATGARANGAWTAAQVLHHCAASIECSLDGFPKAKPAIVRATIGRLVKRKFLAQGYMKHDRAAPIPGVPGPDDGPLADAAARLRAAIARFRASTAPPAMHFVYGPTSKDEYERVHAMHIADHLEGIDY